jgi:RNA polymerase sigma factor (sigma-70 family)
LGYRNAQLFYDPVFGVRFSTYAIASIRSHILNWLRKERRQNFHFDHGINVENRGFSENQDSFEVHEIIRKTILTELEKRIIFLHYFEDLPFRDIGKVLDLSHDRIHQFLRGSILKMRRLLQRRVNI